MAIVKMNKFTLVTFESHKKELLRKLQGFSKVEFINLQDEEKLEKNEVLKELSKDEVDSNSSEYEENLSKAKSSLDFLNSYMPKKSLLQSIQDDRQSLSVEELEELVEKSNWPAISEKVKEKEEQLHDFENSIVKLQGEIDILKPWESLDCSFENLDELNKTAYFIGSIAKQYEEELSSALKDAYVEVVSRNSNDTNVLILVDGSKADETLSLIRNYGFSAFKTDYKDVPQKTIMDLSAKIEDIKTKIFLMKEELASYEEDMKIMQLVYDYYFNKVSREKASTNFLRTNSTVTIQGWCACEDNNALSAICKEVTGEDYYMTFEDVKEDEVEEVPVKLRNSKLVSAFESVTSMYSTPRYDEWDPTPFLTPFYLVFFGMMVADAGYGLTMLLICLLALKSLKLKKETADFLRFGLFVSIPTIIFGMIYGSYFGDILPIPGLLVPTRDVVTILAISIVFGVVQIFAGLIIKFSYLCKMGKSFDAIVDVGSWIIELVSIGIFAGCILLGWPTVVKYIAIAGMVIGALLIIYSGGRNEKSKGAQIGQGLYNLYNITGYVGDLVSYSRLMALGLSGGCIASAFNMLITQMSGWYAIVVIPLLFALIHIFNLGLSLLGAYVHTARLQYVEYFGKFYEGGGKQFEPFTVSEKYMNLKEN